MKKSLIALTLAALPVAAMADVTLYGQIKAGVEISKVKLGEQTAAKLGHEKSSKTATEIADFGSRIGFKGHEHLGNNLNAIWQVEPVYFYRRWRQRVGLSRIFHRFGRWLR